MRRESRNLGPTFQFISVTTHLLLEAAVFLCERGRLGLPIVDLPLHTVHDLGVLTDVEVDRDDVLLQSNL